MRWNLTFKHFAFEIHVFSFSEQLWDSLETSWFWSTTSYVIYLFICLFIYIVVPLYVFCSYTQTPKMHNVDLIGSRWKSLLRYEIKDSGFLISNHVDLEETSESSGTHAFSQVRFLEFWGLCETTKALEFMGSIIN